jgi:hypothetical protein
MTDEFDARDFLRRYYAGIWDTATGGIDALGRWEVEDIDYELPWSEGPTVLRGIEAHARLLAGFAAALTSYEIEVRAIHATLDPSEFVIESTGRGRTRRGTEYRNDYVQFIALRDGKIARVREYFNPLWVRVLGGGHPREPASPRSDARQRH